MNKEQFQSSWRELKGALKTQWSKITDADLLQINGDQDAFHTVIQARYGEMNGDVRKWADRWYARWTGWYEGYQEAKAVLPP